MKRWNLKRPRRRPSPRPTLRFSPPAWAKLVYLRDRGPTEIGGFGVADPQDPLVVGDVALVPQIATSLTTKFDDAGVADYFDRQVDAGLRPEAFARIWVHTHPGDSAEPSGTDELTFARVFRQADWAVMFILARGGATYARLRFRAGPGGQFRIPVEVDFGRPFAGSDQAAWDREYRANVGTPPPEPLAESWDAISRPWLDPWYGPSDLPRDDPQAPFFQEDFDDRDDGSLHATG
jgi:hypothetical protein